MAAVPCLRKPSGKDAHLKILVVAVVDVNLLPKIYHEDGRFRFRPDLIASGRKQAVSVKPRGPYYLAVPITSWP